MRTLVLSVMAAIIGFTVARRTAIPIADTRPDPPAANPVSSPAAAKVPPTAQNSFNPDPAKPAGERLKSAFRDRSPLKTAANAVVVIDAMTAEDFRELSKTSYPSLTPSGYGPNDDFNVAFMDALVARWIEVDPDGALAGIREKESKLILDHGRMVDSGQYIAAFARLRPEALLAEMPTGATWDRFDGTLRSAFQELGARDGAAARGFLDRITDPDRRKEAEVSIALGVAKNDPIAAMTLARHLDDKSVFSAAPAAAERIGPGIMRQVLMMNDGKFSTGSELTQLVLRHPDEDWSAFASDEPSALTGAPLGAISEAAQLSPEEFEHLADRLDELPTSVRGSVATALFMNWSDQEPEQVARWAFARAKPDDATAIENIVLEGAFTRWKVADLEAAERWWSSLPDSKLRTRLGAGLAASLATAGDTEKAIALIRPEAAAESAGIVRSIAARQARENPAAAADWLTSLPATFDISKAVVPVIEAWTGRDAAAAANWIEAQPAGPARDEALKSFIRTAAQSDPGAASAWVTTLSESQTRMQTAELVLYRWNQTDPAGAAAWLKNLPGVDERWRERMLRLGP
ncbi:MAG: hypothetical protein ABI680_08200 [Chthoniobacteraceae bacterium]